MTDTRYTDAATGREWVRSDAVEAQLAEARREALRKVVETLGNDYENLDCGRNPCHGHNERQIAYEAAMETVEALIDEAPAQPKTSVQEAAKCDECNGSCKEYDSGTCGLLDVRKCWKCDGTGRALAGGDSDA